MKEKKRIALVSNNWVPYTGGVVSSLRTQIEELRKQGHRVCLITLDFGANIEKDPPYVKRVVCPFKFKHKKNPMAVPWRANKQVLHLLKVFQPDIIHTHHPFLLGRSALKAAKALNIPIVFTYHSIYEAFAHYFPFLPVVTRPIIKQLVRSFCKAVDGIIAPSSTVAYNLKEQHIYKPIVTIPSGLLPIFVQRPIEKKMEKPYNLLLVSRFAQEKNIPFLLDVFAQLLGPYVFTLAGFGHAYNDIKKYAYKTLKLSPKQVQFIHKPSKEQLAFLYCQAHLFLFSSRHETQGLVLVEAMAGSTPVVAVDGPGQRDIIKHGYNGFIINSKREMVIAIEEIAVRPHLYRQLSIHAYQTASEYRPENMVHELRNFYGKF